jgi:hypothetical protein
MTPALIIALLTAILTDAPELINDVDMLIQDFKGTKKPTTDSLEADFRAKSDALEAKLEGK